MAEQFGEADGGYAASYLKRSVPYMNLQAIKFDLLFDANEYRRSGVCPWTFFAYPTSGAVERGLPPDVEACELLGHLQSRDIDVAIWVNGIAEDTTYFACRKEDIQRLHSVLQELEDKGIIEKDFCRKRSDRLFTNLGTGIEQRVADGALDKSF